MKNYLIAVDIPEREDSVVVRVEDAESASHGRLAAYYHVYGANERPSLDRVRALTTILKTGGIVDAKVYVNHFKESADGIGT